MMEHRKIAILVCLGDALLHAGIHSLLASESDMQVIEGDVHSASQLINVVITDYATAVNLVRGHGCPGQYDNRHPGSHIGRLPPPILVITAHIHANALRNALEYGIHGIVLTGSSIFDMLAGVRAVAQGERYLSSMLARQLYQYAGTEMLTNRQDEVLQLLARGLCNKSIARQLGIAVDTVKVHIKAILSKLDASGRAQAVSIATERGLLACQNPCCAAQIARHQ